MRFSHPGVVAQRAVWLFVCASIVLAALTIGEVRAAELRSFNSIRTPGDLPASDIAELRRVCPPSVCGEPVLRPVPTPVSAAAIRRSAEAIARVWNSTRLETFLGQDFFDRRRLLDTITTQVPRNARLRLLSINSAETIQQFDFVKEGVPTYRASVVTARIRYQIEFRVPASGSVQVDSRDEYLLLVTERIGTGKAGGSGRQ